MKLAVVAGGWHWPTHFYREICYQAAGADLFVVAHRNPELPIVSEEKRARIAAGAGPLGQLDRALYDHFPNLKLLKAFSWQYEERENSIGDWGFFNQWLETHDYREYDVILNCHDDTFIRSRDLFGAISRWWSDMHPSWLVLANSTYPQAPAGYVRGSFEFWKREMLDLIGGRFDLGNVTLTREGKTDSPEGMDALSPWNELNTPLRQFMVEKGLTGRVAYFSPHYRISRWAIEGERGFLNSNNGVPWSLEQGVKELLAA